MTYTFTPFCICNHIVLHVCVKIGLSLQILSHPLFSRCASSPCNVFSYVEHAFSTSPWERQLLMECSTSTSPNSARRYDSTPYALPGTRDSDDDIGGGGVGDGKGNVWNCSWANVSEINSNTDFTIPHRRLSIDRLN